MSEPVAVARARSLARHVKSLGGKPADYAVIVSPQEGFDLLRWYAFQIDESCRSTYQSDLAEAEHAGSPFTMLEGFELFGLPIRALQ